LHWQAHQSILETMHTPKHAAALALLIATFFVGFPELRAESSSERGFYIGTYTGAKSKGVYYCTLDETSGKLAMPVLAAETVNPTFLAMHPGKKWLYAANEIGNFQGKSSGAISAFAIDPLTHTLKLLNQKPTLGDGPCHLTVDDAGKYVLAANYGGGSTVVLPIREDGQLGDPVSFIQHQGSSINPQRQKGPHAHGIYLDKTGSRAFVADLGLDKILVYRFDAANGSLSANSIPWAALKPGAGPRHLALHPKRDYAYSINELDSTITAFLYDPAQGRLKEIQTVSTLPSDFKGVNYPAEIRMHPSGKFLYGSNRGHDSIAAYSIDSNTGKLTLLECVPTQGKNPRNFTIEPSGRRLLAANQDSHNVVVFNIDLETGRLAPAGSQAEVGAPVCIEFVR
jgi:6-phosphogluconolactonase